jgi:two-component system LytT family response regulator
MNRPLRVLIAEDEPLARRKLASLVRSCAELELVGQAEDGEEAWSLARERRPHLVFLDIHMPQLSGLAVVARLRTLRSPPAVVFTTAFDRYAVAAFELAALDYLLKPFGRDRFLQSVERAGLSIAAASGAGEGLERAEGLTAHAARLSPDSRVYARERGVLVPIRVGSIERFEGQDDYVMACTGAQRFLLSLRLADLEERLPSPPFMRVHRSHIVNLDFVARVRPVNGAAYEVEMRDGAPVPVSRLRARKLRESVRASS